MLTISLEWNFLLEPDIYVSVTWQNPGLLTPVCMGISYEYRKTNLAVVIQDRDLNLPINFIMLLSIHSPSKDIKKEQINLMWKQ